MQEQELSLKDYVEVIKRRKKTILLIFFIAIIGSAVLSFVLPPVYQVKSTIKIGQIVDLSTFEKTPIESAVASSQFLQGPGLLTDAIRDLKLPFTLKKLRKRVSAEPIGQEEDLVEIRIEMADPVQALDTANYLVDRLEKEHQQAKELHENKSQILARYAQHIASITQQSDGVKQSESAIITEYDEQVKGINNQLSIIEANKKEVIAEYDEATKGINNQLSIIEANKKEIIAEYEGVVEGVEHQSSQIKNDVAAAKEQMAEVRRDSQPLSEAESRLLVGYMGDIEAKEERYDLLLGQLREAQSKKTELLASNQSQYNSTMDALRQAQSKKTELLANNQSQYNSTMDALRQAQSKKTELLKDEQQQYDVLMKEKREVEVEKDKLERLESDKMYTTETIVPAEEPEEPIRPNIPLNIVVAAIIGLVVGSGLVFFLESLEKAK